MPTCTIWAIALLPLAIAIGTPSAFGDHPPPGTDVIVLIASGTRLDPAAVEAIRARAEQLARSHDERIAAPAKRLLDDLDNFARSTADLLESLATYVEARTSRGYPTRLVVFDNHLASIEQCSIFDGSGVLHLAPFVLPENERRSAMPLSGPRGLDAALRRSAEIAGDPASLSLIIRGHGTNKYALAQMDVDFMVSGRPATSLAWAISVLSTGTLGVDALGVDALGAAIFRDAGISWDQLVGSVAGLGKVDELFLNACSSALSPEQIKELGNVGILHTAQPGKPIGYRVGVESLDSSLSPAEAIRKILDAEPTIRSSKP